MNISSPEISPMRVLCWVTFHPFCKPPRDIFVGTALSTISIMGMLAVGPAASQGLFSQGYQCKSTEIRFQGCSIYEPGPTLGAMRAAQTLAWASPHGHAPTKPIVAKIRRIQAARRSILCPFGCPIKYRIYKARCRGVNKPMAHVATLRDFSPAS